MTVRPLASLSSCPICAGMGWVCEEHPDKPWEHDGCGAAGAPCICNPTGHVDMPTVFEQVPQDGPVH
jgi:hypothetical protein